MRYKWLLLYWLAVAAVGAASFFIPVAGWAFAVGAFAYLVATIPGWLLMGGFFAHMEQRDTTFGIDNRRFAGLMAGCAVLASGIGLASGLHFLGWGGASLLYLSGEWVLMDRLFKGRAIPAAT